MSKRDVKGCAALVLVFVGILLAISLPSSLYRRWHRDGYELTEATILWPPGSHLRSGNVRIAATGEELSIRKTHLDASSGTEPVWYNPEARLVVFAGVFDERVVSAKRHPNLGKRKAAPRLAMLEHSFWHDQPARRIAFSPDSTLLATTSVDATLKLWRVADRQLVHTMKHPMGVTAAAFSSDGQFVVSSSYDRALRVWRVADGTLVRTIPAHEGTVWTVAVSSDGRIASGGEDKQIRMWRLADGAPLGTVPVGHTLNVWSVAFSPDAQTVVSGSFDRTVKLWRGGVTRTLTGHEQAVVGVAFSPDGQLIASGGDDSAVRIWRASDGQLLRTIQGDTDHVYSVAFSPDSQLLAGGGRGQGGAATLAKQIFGGDGGRTVHIWRVSDGALLQTITAHGGNVFSVAFSSDGQWLATGSEDRSVKLWRVGKAPGAPTPPR